MTKRNLQRNPRTASAKQESVQINFSGTYFIFIHSTLEQNTTHYVLFECKNFDHRRYSIRKIGINKTKGLFKLVHGKRMLEIDYVRQSPT